MSSVGRLGGEDTGRETSITKIHDEVGMRHFYAEWSKRMGRLASDPSIETEAGKPARI